MADGEEEPARRAGRHDTSHRHGACHRKLARLRDSYLKALTCTDARAVDAGFVRSRAALGAILRALGALPDDPAASLMPGPDAGT